jgi:ParB family chromosome partitioning protein
MSRRKLLLANNPLLSGPKLEQRRARESELEVQSNTRQSPFQEVALQSIERDPGQPRKVFDEEKIAELASSIEEYGILSPLLVRELERGRFLLIAGERRLRAAESLGLAVVPVIVEAKEREHADVLAIQLIENIQREDLNPVERAQAIVALRDSYGLSVREIGKKLGVSKSLVQRAGEILTLPADLLNALRQGASESKVLLIARVDDPIVRASLLEDLDYVSRSELQKEVERQIKPKGSPSKPKQVREDDLRVSEEIQRSLGLKVKLQRGRDPKSGRLVIDFYSDDDLKELFKRLIQEE